MGRIRATLSSPILYDVEDAKASRVAAAEENVNIHYDVRLPRLSWRRRAQIPLIAAVVSTLIRSIGPTLRFEYLGGHHLDEIHARGERAIGAFWHRSIFSSVWCWKDRGVVVMNTTNFDGQWTRKVIEGLGFATAQGSSSRGGLRGLAVMARKIAEGHDTAFTIDGPRGPRYVAKPGPVMLARRTGQPIILFHVGLERAYTFQKSWDLFQIPHLFSRAVMVMAPPLYVAGWADAALIDAKHAEMQAELERVRDVAEGWFTLPEQARARHRADFGT
jgi:lysophospholipid acyltransferase (LPLAT)-like uncharacterized protein